MRLATFAHDETISYGAVVGDDVVDLRTDLLEGWSWEVSPTTLRDLVANGPDALERAATVLTASERSIPLEAVRLLAPIHRPPKMLYVGRNYAEHASESSLDLLPYPSTFAKLPSNIIGPGDVVELPAMSEQVDYEGELAVVIGRDAIDVDESDALSHIAGYTVANDVSARDIQFRDKQLALAKNFRTFAPLGPWLVTADEIPDPSQLRIQVWVNDLQVQDGRTADMIFDVPTIISFLSRAIGLDAGDVIATGTPSGVGFARDPQLFLRAGDVVRVDIDAIGSLINRFDRVRPSAPDHPR